MFVCTHLAGPDYRLQCVSPDWFAGFSRLLCKPIHLCGTLRSFQTLLEAGDKQEHKFYFWQYELSTAGQHSSTTEY